jgi:hypothetical protein
MKTENTDLAVRKDLLVAQSALYRSRLRYEAAALRSRATLGPVLSGLLSLAVGRSRGAKWIGAAGAILAIARTAISIIGLFRK